MAEDPDHQVQERPRLHRPSQLLQAFSSPDSYGLVVVRTGWEEPLAKEPKGVVIPPVGRPLLGRKRKGESQRELRDFGLA